MRSDRPSLGRDRKPRFQPGLRLELRDVPTPELASDEVGSAARDGQALSDWPPPRPHSGDLFSCHAGHIADVSVFSLAAQFAVDDRGGPLSPVELFQGIVSSRTRNQAAGERKVEREKKDLRAGRADRAGCRCKSG